MKWILKERLNVDRSVDTHNAPVTFWTSSSPNSTFLVSFLQQLKSWSDNQGLAWVWRSEEFMIHQFWSRFCVLANEANWQAGKRAEKKRDWSRVDPILVYTHTVFFVPWIICACKHNTFAQWVPYSFVHIHELCLCVMDLILVPIMCWFCWSLTNGQVYYKYIVPHIHICTHILFVLWIFITRANMILRRTLQETHCGKDQTWYLSKQICKKILRLPIATVATNINSGRYLNWMHPTRERAVGQKFSRDQKDYSKVQQWFADINYLEQCSQGIIVNRAWLWQFIRN